jgi:dolichol-phosphate mannosyltransferase
LKTSRAGDDVKLTAFIRALTGSLGSATLSRFIAVGVSGTVLNEAILGAQVTLAHIDPSLAVPLAFEASMAWNFALNDRYTFHGGHGKFIRLAQYNLSSIGSFLTQFAAVRLLTDSAGVNYLLSSLIGIGIGFFVNYYLSTRIWKPREYPAS